MVMQCQASIDTLLYLVATLLLHDKYVRIDDERCMLVRLDV